MSIYEVHKFCRSVLHDADFRELARTEPHEAIRTFNLSDDEREAMLRGDVASLHRMGASAFLLLVLSRFEIFGLKLTIYNNRMRKLQHSPGRPQS